MVTNKHITKIVYALMAVTLCLCLLAMGFSAPLAAALGGTGVTMEYETRLFDPEQPLTVNILMDEAQWSSMLENAMSEEYYTCDVEIGGTTFYRVGIRPKGNTSLSNIVSNPDTDRYSFKLEFDQFVSGQTCFGLDKLVLNNNYADATNMKEALVYDMFRYLGADASLYNYAKVCVNGEYWGVYLALEAVEDSFLLRNYGVNSGALYKPEGMGIGGGGGGGKGGFSMNGGGADLNWSDDDLDSYSTIWDGEVGATSAADHTRVVQALKNISQGNDLERYMDVENLLRYMAVHVFAQNEDSLSGSMAHNYYLYEENGKLNLLPWDYNLALGGMHGGQGASDTVNAAIDDSFSSTSFFDGLLSDETYLTQYHAYLRELVEGYIGGGAFDEFYTRTRALLDELVETDPTAFYTYDEYNDAAETLYEVVGLRGQSVTGQLDGAIPSTSEGQRADSSALVDTGDLDLSIMGTMDVGNGDMGGGGGFGGFGGGFRFGGGGFGGADFDPDSSRRPDGGGTDAGGTGTGGAQVHQTSATVGQTPGGDFDPTQNGGQTPGGSFDPTQNGGQMPGGDFDPTQNGGQMPGGDFDPTQNGGQMPGGDFDPTQGGGQMPGGDFDPTQGGGQMPSGDFDPTQNGGQMPGGDMPGAPGGESGGSSMMQNLILYGVSFAVLLIALAIALLFKRRSHRR